MSLQGIARESGVSKALVLYHHHEKDALLVAVAERLVARDVEALRAAAGATDVLEAWRAVAGSAERRAERLLLAALLAEAELRAHAAALQAMRAQAANGVAQALLASAGLRSRIAPSLLGRVTLAQLDGVAAATHEQTPDALDAQLDAQALALLGLGS